MTTTEFIETDETTEVVEARDTRYFIFCPLEPEKIVILSGGRNVQFRNGRLDSVTSKLRAQDVEYFRDKMAARMPRPEYIVWDGPLSDPLLQSILSPLVAEAIAHGATAVGGVDDLKMTQIRLSMMLAGDAGDIALISVDQQTRNRLTEIATKPVRSGLGVLPDQFAPSSAMAPAPAVTEEQLKREQEMINAAVRGDEPKPAASAAESAPVPGSAFPSPRAENPFEKK